MQDLLSTQTLHLPVTSDDIELNEEEIAAATEAGIKKAKLIKADLFEYERRKELAKKVMMESAQPWSGLELWNYAKKRGDEIVKIQSGNPSKIFEEIPFQKKIISALCLYFTGNPAFENIDAKELNSIKGSSFSLTKGIWLWGQPGVGKTLLMDMFRINKRQCFGLVQCTKLAYLWSKEGDFFIEPYMRPVNNGEIFSSTPFNQKLVGICYNDLGTEQIPVKFFGNTINVMEQIILNSYDKKVPFWHRHVTTNLTGEQVKSIYGTRVSDRIIEMFNIIDITGKSLRK